MFIRQQIELGTTQREALKQVCRQAGLGQPLVEKVFYGWGGLIKEMCDRGWIAYQSGTEKSFVLPQVEWMETEQARHILLERYFQTYGPATWADCAWFTGWKMAEIRLAPFRPIYRRSTIAFRHGPQLCIIPPSQT